MTAPAARTRRTAGTSAPTDSLGTYLEEIGAYPLLSRPQEAELSRRIAAGESAAVQELVCANLRFVVAIAKRYRHHGVALSDLINEGNIGLMRAAEKFDGDKGVKFISYAVWWVRQAIVQALSENAHTVRIPVHRAGAVFRLGRHANALRQVLGREPTQHELAGDLGVSDQEIEASLPMARAALSLNAPATADGDLSLLELLPDERGDAADESTMGAGLTSTIEDAIAALRPREAKILRLYFGFDGNDAMTLERIGEMLGITRERVRQIKERGLSRLRRSQSAAALASFAGD